MRFQQDLFLLKINLVESREVTEMKLMVQADDYGITTAVTDGIVECGRNGVLTQTGLFTNMPSSAYAVRRWRNEIPHILLGQDINFVTGSPVTDPKLIPSLVQENGRFKTSSMHRKWDMTEKEHIPYEEAYLEADNQVKKFLELVGEKPGYIGGHAYSTNVTNQVIRDIAKKYDIPMRADINEKVLTVPDGKTEAWIKLSVQEDGRYAYTVETMLAEDPIEYFKNGALDYLDQTLKEDGVAIIHLHAGFVDRELVRLSSFSFVRMMEADFLCSPELKNWIAENHVQLVNYSDFYDVLK